MNERYKRDRHVLNLFIKVLIKKGLQGKSERNVFLLMRLLKRYRLDFAYLMRRIVKKVRPIVAVKVISYAGKRMYVPYRFPRSRSFTTVFIWLKQNAKKGRGKSMFRNLLSEFLNTANYESLTISSSKDLSMLALANRFYARYYKKKKRKKRKVWKLFMSFKFLRVKYRYHFMKRRRLNALSLYRRYRRDVHVHDWINKP